ncbi:hypothetical protein ABZP36_008977 [Zizania latifolia]
MGSMLGSSATEEAGPENGGASGFCFTIIVASVCVSLMVGCLLDGGVRVLGLILILFMSQRSQVSARPGIVPLLPVADDDAGPPGSLRSQEAARMGHPLLEVDDDGVAEPAGFFCASHLLTESARPGLGMEGGAATGRMMRHGDEARRREQRQHRVPRRGREQQREK